MEIKVNAIVIKAIDYKENDKILTLYSLEKGKITCGIKGVKKSGAKLKFASEPFCFAEYILAKKGDRYTVINVTHIDSFYNLRTNLEKYYTGEVVLETINSLTEQETPDANLFSLIITTIKNICYNQNEKAILSKYLHNLVELNGYGINSVNCHLCGEDIDGRVFFRFSDATFACYECYSETYREIKKETYTCLNYIRNNTFEQLARNTEKQSYETLLKFLFYYIYVKTDIKIKTADMLLNET